MCERSGGKGVRWKADRKRLRGVRNGGPGGAGRCVCPELPRPAAPSPPRQVVYQVPLKENHVLKRNVDQQLRIKIVYDGSVEE